jgi:hypothetical protein
MEQKIFHGNITAADIAQAIVAHFNRGNFQVQQIGDSNKTIVQIASSSYTSSGGQTALTVTIQPVIDGVNVSLGNQQWLGIAASLGSTVFSVLRNPLNLFGRLDDLAQDIESLQLSQEVWNTIEEISHTLGAGQELSERLKRITCNYCGSANPVGESNCIACGAPLGEIQPRTCKHCGFVVKSNEKKCPNCGLQIQ